MQTFKLIHTADIHIQSVNDRGFKALEEILKTTNEHKISTLCITGDLFEDDKYAFDVRTDVKELFESYKEVKIILTPGNHDENSYTQNINYGSNVLVLSKKPYDKIRIDKDISIYGIPFQRGRDISKTLDDISKDTEQKDAFSILLTHGTLIDQWLKDILVHLSKYESDRESFFIHSEDFTEYKINLVLMGHYHNFTEKNLDKTLITYAGTPQITSIKNSGKRRVSLIEINLGDRTSKILPVYLNLPYVLQEGLKIIPGREEEVVNEIDKLVQILDKNAQLSVSVEGFTKISEKDFQDKLNRIEKTYRNRDTEISINNRTKQLSSVSENALAGRFLRMWEDSFLKSGRKNTFVYNRALELALEAFEETILKKKN